MPYESVSERWAAPHGFASITFAVLYTSTNEKAAYTNFEKTKEEEIFFILHSKRHGYYCSMLR